MPYTASPPASQDLRAAVALRTRRRLRAALRRAADDPRLDLLEALLGAGPSRPRSTRDSAASGDGTSSSSSSSSGSSSSSTTLSTIDIAAPLGFSGDLRALAFTLEQSARIVSLARAALHGPRRALRDRARHELFEEVAATPWLREVAPRQLADRAFAVRAQALGLRLQERALDELPLLVASFLRCGFPGRRFALPAPAREDPDTARTAAEHTLGDTALLLVLSPAHAAASASTSASTTASRASRRPATTVEIGEGSLLVRSSERLLLELPRRDPRPVRGTGAAVVARPLVPGSPSIRIGRRLRSGRRSLRVGAPVDGLDARLAAPLALLRAAWPEAWEEVHLFTEMVVPLDEPGTVSYSLPARPGISYINVWKKSVLELADDLLHETAHHKLHAIEELEPLVDDDGSAVWWSPWRSAWRPLRGILHACYTFTYGALLFARLAAIDHPLLAPVARRRFARRRLLEEEAMLRFSVRDLGRARRRGLLAPAGREIASELASLLEHTIAKAAAREERLLQRERGAGSAELVLLARLRRSLEAMRRVRGAGLEEAEGPDGGPS